MAMHMRPGMLHKPAQCIYSFRDQLNAHIRQEKHGSQAYMEMLMEHKRHL